MRIGLIFVAVIVSTVFGLVLTAKVIENLNSIEHLAELTPDRLTADGAAEPVDAAPGIVVEPVGTRAEVQAEAPCNPDSWLVRVLNRLANTRIECDQVDDHLEAPRT